MAIKRLLDCQAADFMKMSSQDLLESILASEGRVVMAEVNVGVQSDIKSTCNAEIAKAFGADLILLNRLDVQNPVFKGLDDPSSVAELKQRLRVPIGLNLEPVDPQAETSTVLRKIEAGRVACLENYRRCQEAGYDFVLLTGNPGTGVTNRMILQSLAELRQHYQGLIMVGKMHQAGVKEDYFDLETLKAFVDAGAQVILLPAVGTVPGVTRCFWPPDNWAGFRSNK